VNNSGSYYYHPIEATKPDRITMTPITSLSTQAESAAPGASAAPFDARLIKVMGKDVARQNGLVAVIPA
jgi:hypothetical protein